MSRLALIVAIVREKKSNEEIAGMYLRLARKVGKSRSGQIEMAVILWMIEIYQPALAFIIMQVMQSSRS